MQRVVALGVVVLIIVIGVIQLLRPLPSVQAQSLQSGFTVPGAAPRIPWPAGTEVALQVPEAGWSQSYGTTQPLPIGSLAKMMTAYLLLKQHPLASGAQGPSITVTEADVQLYQHEVATQQSLVPLVVGESLSERQCLEALLVASGNDIAEMVASWVSGSNAKFTALMNSTAKQMGMTHTHYVGPSGLRSGTVSTPQDQLILAEAAMKNSTFAELAAMPQMTWPNTTGLIYNYNYDVGHDGIVGVKTGSTIQAGGCFVFAAPRKVGSQQVMVYGAILGRKATSSQSIGQLKLALNDGISLLNAVSGSLTTATPVHSGQVVGELKAPWGAKVSLQATQSVTTPAVQSTRGTEQLVWHPSAKGTGSGVLKLQMQQKMWTVPVRAAGTLAPPPLSWKLLRL